MAYTLIISEKPSASAKIAHALAEGDVKKVSRHGSYYFKIQRAGKEIVVAPAVGHLFVLTPKGGKGEWTYPVFETEWNTTFSRGSSWSKKYYQNLKALASKASDFISACDYDIEGSVIAYNVLRFLCKTEQAGRMKFSTLTRSDLVEAYEKTTPELDFPQINAGLARHHLDWAWGINSSRALILALKKAGGYKTLSTGRVQGPTLKILDERQKEIKAFIPKPYWNLQLIGLVDGHEIVALHTKGNFWAREEVQEAFDKSQGRPAKVDEVKREEYKQYPFPPFDLTSLQRDAYMNFHYSPKQTLDIAQSLYGQALISYPRTSSQKLPPKIGYKRILENLKKQDDYSQMAEALLKKAKLWPRQGKKEDPAHPAIYPTGNIPKKLNNYQRKIYDIIIKRFLACFADPAVRETMKAVIGVNGEAFKADGARTIQANWMDFYRPYARFKEVLLPDMKEGQAVEVKSLDILDKETQPPKRYTQASILKIMESEGLGTKATRSGILQTLYDRGYITESSILVTRLGEVVANALEKFCPDIVSVELTRKFEKEMEEIQEGKKKWEEVVQESRGALEKILEKFKANELKIGKELLKGVIEAERQKNVVGKCMKCKKGNLRIIYSKTTHKRFVACDGYPKCRNTFGLPQRGSVTVLNKKCKCGLGLISVKNKGKRPWLLCIKCGFAKKFKARKGKAEKMSSKEDRSPPKVEKKPAAKTKKA